MRILLIIAGIGNLVDTVATVYLTKMGHLEANPVMRWLLQIPGVFVVVKIVVMTALLLWLWYRREDKHATPLAAVAAVVYGLISAYYLVFFTVKKIAFINL